MIEKLDNLRHSIISNSKKDREKSQKDKNNNHKQSQGSDKKHNQAFKHNIKLSLEEVIEKLNNFNYYKSKSISFILQKNHDCDIVTINMKGKIIQKLDIYETYQLYERIKDQKENFPIKGGILNMNI